MYVGQVRTQWESFSEMTVNPHTTQTGEYHDSLIHYELSDVPCMMEII
jgi:hypothetical protein